MLLLKVSLCMAVIRGNLWDSNRASAGNLGFFSLCNSVELVSYSTLEMPTSSFRPDLIYSENICQHATEFFSLNISISSSSVIGYFISCK